MKIMKQVIVLLCLLALVLPVSATEVPTEVTEPPTLPPLVMGVRTLSDVPENWSPLSQRTTDQNAIL